MKRNILFFLLAALTALTAQAQKLTVESMKAAPYDISASQYERKDLNQQSCALVKVQLAGIGAEFEGNVIGKSEYKTGEYWVYMSEQSYMLTVKHPNFVPLAVNFRDYGIKGVEQKVTYVLTLNIPQAGAQPLDDGMRYLLMSVEPANATVYVNDQLQQVQNGTLTMLLPMGEYSYRVEAPAYETQSGTFTVGNEKVTLPIKLKSTMATLSVSTATNGTQIYINDQLRGTSFWSGQLPAGTYRVEGRLTGYRNYRQNITLSQRASQQVNIPELQAITGVINVNYQPANAEIWIDGKKAGNSPDIFRGIVVGSHRMEIRMNGYETKSLSITVEEGKTLSVSGSLTAKTLPSATTNTQVTSNQNGNTSVGKVFDVVEEMPQFKGCSYKYYNSIAQKEEVINIDGGPSGLMQYLSLAIKYPVVAEENGVQGRVFCTFVVEKDGSITDVKVLKSLDPALDKEAVRVLRAMPKWLPGKQNGSPVRVKYTVPVTFRLQ